VGGRRAGGAGTPGPRVGISNGGLRGSGTRHPGARWKTLVVSSNFPDVGASSERGRRAQSIVRRCESGGGGEGREKPFSGGVGGNKITCTRARVRAGGGDVGLEGGFQLRWRSGEMDRHRRQAGTQEPVYGGTGGLIRCLIEMSTDQSAGRDNLGRGCRGRLPGTLLRRKEQEGAPAGQKTTIRRGHGGGGGTGKKEADQGGASKTPLWRVDIWAAAVAGARQTRGRRISLLG